MNNRLTNISLILMYVTGLLVSIAALFLIAQNNASREAASIKASAERQDMKRQNDYIICVLQVLPEERTKATVQECKDRSL